MELLSYSTARKLALSNKGVSYSFDAGDGWTSTVVWDKSFVRLVFTSTNPEGMVIL
jgi:hypothetical protein